MAAAAENIRTTASTHRWVGPGFASNKEVSKHLNSGDTNNEVDDIVCCLAVLLLHRDRREGFRLGWLLQVELLRSGSHLLCSRSHLRRSCDLLCSGSGLLRSQGVLRSQVLQAEVLQAQVPPREVLQDPLPQPQLLRSRAELLCSRANLRRSGCLCSDVRCSHGFGLQLVLS